MSGARDDYDGRPVIPGVGLHPDDEELGRADALCRYSLSGMDREAAWDGVHEAPAGRWRATGLASHRKHHERIVRWEGDGRRPTPRGMPAIHRLKCHHGD